MKTGFIFFSLLLPVFRFGFSQSVTIRPTATGTGIIESQTVTSGITIPKTSQREAIASPQKGLWVFDETAHSNWYHNGSNWVQLNNLTPHGYWQVNALNQYNVNSGNVGIGVNPTKAMFETVGDLRSSQAIFGSNSAGISIQANTSMIGFNMYRAPIPINGSYGQKYLTTGYGMANSFETYSGSGKAVWQLYDSGNRDSYVSPHPSFPMILENTGSLILGRDNFISFPPTPKLNVLGNNALNDYTKLGENSPMIRYETFTGTTVSDQFGTTELTLGPETYQAGKIIKISVLIDCGGTLKYVSPNQCSAFYGGDSFYSGYCYYVHLINDYYPTLRITHLGTESANTLGKPFKVMVIYQK